MSNLQTVALCSVSEYRKDGKEFDRNGNQNVFLSPLSGKIPNKCMVMAGTVAINNEIAIGKTYVFKFSEKQPKEDGSDASVFEEYGRQFNTQKISEASVMDILQATSTGQADVINVSQDVEIKEEVTAEEKMFAEK